MEPGHPYIGGGGNFLRPRFQVGFTDQLGHVDRTLVTVDLNRIAMFTGVSAELTNTVDLSAQAYGVRQGWRDISGYLRLQDTALGVSTKR